VADHWRLQQAGRGWIPTHHCLKGGRLWKERGKVDTSYLSLGNHHIFRFLRGNAVSLPPSDAVEDC
jgi:hypothetical protein